MFPPCHCYRPWCGGPVGDWSVHGCSLRCFAPDALPLLLRLAPRSMNSWPADNIAHH